MVTSGDGGGQGASTPNATRAVPRTWDGSITTASASTTGCRTSPARSDSPSSNALTRCSRTGRPRASLYREALSDFDELTLPCPDRGDARRGWFVFVVQLPPRRRPRRDGPGTRRSAAFRASLLPGRSPDELLPGALRASRRGVPGLRGGRSAIDRASIFSRSDRAQVARSRAALREVLSAPAMPQLGDARRSELCHVSRCPRKTPSARSMIRSRSTVGSVRSTSASRSHIRRCSPLRGSSPTRTEIPSCRPASDRR